ncbi:hypothetical protein N9Y60_00635 [Crocinitomicaceae bacterium]|nr:hypothetical protein [Crocinitomicaceae bacterium]
MKNIITVILIGGALTIASCNTEPNADEPVPNTYDIELVDGKKWTVKPEMMQHIRNMESDINKESKTNNPDYKRLGELLDENIQLLTSNCTMTGKAHDELHKWLVPFIGLVEKLNEADSSQKASAFKTLQVSIKEFNYYFE